MDKSNNSNNSSIQINNKICVHTYRLKIDTNINYEKLFGFSDFLRGTAILFEYCKIYGYQLYIDRNSHTLFQYLQNDNPIYISLEDLISNKDKPELEQINLVCTGAVNFKTYLGQFRYNFFNVLANNNLSKIIDESGLSILNFILHDYMLRLFDSNKNFSIVTNAFEINDVTRLVDTTKPLSDDCKVYLKSLLCPSEKINNIINTLYNDYKFTDYEIIHLRFHDNCIINFSILDSKLSIEDECHMKKLLKYFDNLDITKNYILVSNSIYRAKYFINKYPYIKYFEHQSICHLGYGREDEEAVFNTLIDLYLISKSKKIHSYSYYMNSIADDYTSCPKWKSGFSYFISKIYDIPYDLWLV